MCTMGPCHSLNVCPEAVRLVTQLTHQFMNKRIDMCPFLFLCLSSGLLVYYSITRSLTLSIDEKALDT